MLAVAAFIAFCANAGVAAEAETAKQPTPDKRLAIQKSRIPGKMAKPRAA